MTQLRNAIMPTSRNTMPSPRKLGQRSAPSRAGAAALAGLLAGAGFYAPAFAEAQPENQAAHRADDTLTLETVTIIADPLRLPGSAQTLDAEDLRRFSSTDPHQLLSQVPGINFRSEEGYGLRPNIGIRGTPNERSGKITVMEDGILVAPAPYSAPSAYYFPSMGRMHRVEVVKGPSAITEGPYTIGGALNLISTPIPEAAGHHGTVHHAMGEDSLSRSNATYGFNNGDGFGALVETQLHSANGFDRIQGSDNPTGFEVDDYMVKLRYQGMLGTVASQEIALKYSLTDQVSNQTYVGLAETDFHRSPHMRYGLSALDRFDSKHRGLSLRYSLSFELVDWDATLFSNRFERDWFKVHDLDIDVFDTSTYERTRLGGALDRANAGDARALAVLNGVPGDGDATVRLKHNARTYRSEGLQTRLTWAHGPHTLRVGLRTLEDEEDRLQSYAYTDQQNGALGALRDIEPPAGGDNRLTGTRALALFLEETLVHGNWTTRVGMRREAYKTTERRYEGGFARSGLADGYPKTRADDSVTLFGVGVNWAASNDLNWFAGLHQGFTPVGGGANPENANNWELGMRYADDDGRRAEAALFLSDYQNIVGECRNANQGAFSDCDPGVSFDGGNATIQGIELHGEQRFEPSEELELSLAVTYSYVNAQFDTTFQHGDYWGDVQAGDRIPYLPERQSVIRAGLIWRDWAADLQRSAYSATCAIAACSEFTHIEAWQRYDLKVSKAFPERGIDAYMTVQNLGDSANLVNRNPNNGARAQSPRTTLIGIRHQF